MKQSKSIIRQDSDYFYLKCNNPNKKGVIIYVHGFSSTYYLHHEFVLSNHFDEYDYFSMNFHNENPSDSNRKKLDEYDINYYVYQLINEINKHDFQDIILIGHSMGGGISLLVYMKLASRIKKIILVNAINPIIYTSSIGLKYLWSVIRNEKWQIKSLETNTRLQTDSQMKFVINEYLNYELERFLLLKYRFLFLGIKLISPKLYAKLNKLYKTITIPVLFISGKDDKVIPSNATKKYLSKLNNNYIEFVAIENTKHIPFVEAFEEYNRLVWEFINRDKTK